MEEAKDVVGYVTYLADGTLDGSYLQEPTTDHASRMIVVPEDVRLSWVLYKANDARNGVELAPVPAPVQQVPPSVTRRQARQALLLKGLLDRVDPAIASIEDNIQRQLAEIEWQDSLNFERNRPLVIQIGTALGLDSDGLDELFIFAATL